MKEKWWLVWCSLAICCFSLLSVIYFLDYAKKHSTSLYKKVDTISPANKEVTNYFLSYLFPLLGTDAIADKWQYAAFFYFSLVFYICFSENYNFNPLISALGYKFYEAEDNTGVGFVLISREVITNLKDRDFEVIQLTDYTFMHVIRK
ncbi:hypothetical protein I5N00_14015 [Serratia sp. JKS000199]|nr:hypothetical protein [Serratia sp. JKS000199]MBH3185342.1 hypothetical protein [Serratia sp. JKS000199]